MASKAHGRAIDRAGFRRATISRHLELADLMVKPGDEGCITFMAFVLVPAEDAGRSYQQGLFQAWIWPGWT